MDKLAFEHVTHVYPAAHAGDEGTLALQDLSFSVAPGESLAIIGPSGCGKSSTLMMAAGLLVPARGTVCIDGAPVVRPRQKTGLILQDFGLLPWKSVRKNVELGLKVRGVSRDARRSRAEEALALVGLSDFADDYPASLSGGMRQRLALARSLAFETDLLLMDEPLSALDALLREQLQDTLLELWATQGYAQVLVTHSIEEAVFLGQRIVVLSARPGHIVGTVDNPHVGLKGFRGSDEFFRLSTGVRALLHETCGQERAYA